MQENPESFVPESAVIDIGISEDALSLQQAYDVVTAPAHGAVTTFVGVVRNLNQGRKVLGVSYDAFAPLCLTTFRDICEKAQLKWGPLKIYCWHYKGRLDVGGISVILAVSSPHRDESYQANRYLIEEIKHRAPIWKMEHYVDGDSEWTEGCELCQDDHSHKKL